MGGFSSRAIIDYDEAKARLGSSEVAKIEEGFARLASGGHDGQLLRSEFRAGFLNSVAGTPVPEEIAAALFHGFDSDESGGISVKEFVCGFAVLRYGSPEEKLRMLFAVYDANNDKRLSDRDLACFANALADGRGATRERAVDDALKALAQAGPSIGFDRFARWAQEHINSPLVAWVFDMEQRLAAGFSDWIHPNDAPSPRTGHMIPLERSESAVEREEWANLLSISCKTGLDLDLVTELGQTWKAVAVESQFNVVDATSFANTLPSVPPRLMDSLFLALDKTKSGTISMSEWIEGFGVCMAGSAAECRMLCFNMFATVGIDGTDESSAWHIPPTAAEELHRFAQLAASVFAEPPGGQAFDPPCWRDQQRHIGLIRPALDLEPWASDANTLVRGLGCIVRIDLNLQPRDPHEERAIVDRANAKFDPERPGQKGDTWYLISARWWERWCESTGADAKPQGHSTPSIDNSALVDNGYLRIGLSHRIDYEVITKQAWRALNAWYGGPGPDLARQVIELDGRLELEMYPLRLRVTRTDQVGNVLLLERAIEISRATLLGDVKKAACALHSITEPSEIYHRSTPNTDWELGDEAATLHALGFIDGHRILLQLQGTPQTPHGIGNLAFPKTKDTVVGLQNLGNTCYMNSALQCLIHTPLLPDYFNVEYRFDINTEGTWGMGGKLAVAFAELLEDIRNARKGSGIVAPRAVKQTTGDFERQFAGWKQQDAQEFLSVFLAGLSDDVNRMQTKPYVELKDSDGRPSSDVAQEFWSAHCSRERSVIASLFSGQFRSVLRCNVCGHENAAFDPFSFLPIALPEHAFRWVTCNVVSNSEAGIGQHTVQVCARVPKQGRVSDLLRAVAGFTGLDPSDLLTTDVVEGYVFQVWESQQPLSAISDDARPMVFQVPPVATTPSGHPASANVVTGGEVPMPDMPPEASELSAPVRSLDFTANTAMSNVVIYLVHRRLRKVQRYFLNPYKSELFGVPILLRVPTQCHARQLYQAAWRLVQQLVPDLERSDEGWPFSLSTVKQDGSACASCSWRQGCLGCVVRVGPHEQTVQLSAGDTLGIDWDARVLQQQYKAKIAAYVQVHDSVELARLERSAPEKVTQCLDGLVKPEELTAYCRVCTRKAGDYTESPHCKDLKIWACPPLLVLQLKRFHSNQAASYKLHNLVTFPQRLDLRNFLAEGTKEVPVVSEREFCGHEPLKDWDKPLRERDAQMFSEAVFSTLSREMTAYKLYAVVNHIGGGMGSGHYTAYVRRGGQWFCCNDDHVYSISEEDIVTPHAYLLFYARSDVEAQELQLHDVFPTHNAKAIAVDPEAVKKKVWVRSGNGDTGANKVSSISSSAAGFCNVM